MTGGPRPTTSDSEATPPTKAASVIRKLREDGASLAVAESCTGGWLCRDLTAVAGASSVFWGGVIAYDNAAKLNPLAVPAEIIQRHGAVSEPVALSMASGVVRLSRATWGVAVTGVAGPGGGTESKPVGTVCIAVAGPSQVVRTYHLPGNRQDVRREAVAKAFDLLEEAMRAT